MAGITLTTLVITYNHEKFIEEALEGVLMQQTEFECEVIVSEDCSTDNTRAIVERVAREHPERLRVMLSERNLNDNTVLRRGIEAARGRYLALLDGDDVWTDPAKLQKQVDFLESRPDCSMCFHNARVVYDDRSHESHLYLVDEPSPVLISARKPKPLSTLEDVVRAFFAPTCSTVFRTEYLRDMPAWYDGLAAGDHPLHVFCAEHGYVAYLDQVMADYRVHAGGLWTVRGRYERLEDVEAVVEVFDAINQHLDRRFDHVVDPYIERFYRARAVAFYRDRKYRSALACARGALGRRPVRRRAKRLLSLPRG